MKNFDSLRNIFGGGYKKTRTPQALLPRWAA